MQAVKTAGLEPIPGYRLVEPLGRGGFGEVWKCIAPGGLGKAIKFVAGESLDGGDGGARQELRALQHIKEIRHPFLLSIERVEVIDGELLIVMELAERSLHELLQEFQESGQPGIPRDELLYYLQDAAEALDVLNHEHGLQHLDVKPRNLFLVGKHVKVADYGLVNSLAELSGNKPHAVQLGAVTPLYAAPESFLGRITMFCDQYSLAVTYCELLTGTLPFNGRNFRQLALQHTQANPDLSRLPEQDRAGVLRAMAKEPTHRFPSCADFIRALSGHAMPPALQVSPSKEVRSLKHATKFEIRKGDMACTPPVSALSTPSMTKSLPSGNLSDYRFLECSARLPTGEVWKGLAPGGTRCIIRLLTSTGDGFEDGVLDRFATLDHEALARPGVIRDGNRIALVLDERESSLADRLKHSFDQGKPGIPRIELLQHLRRVAETLDSLYSTYRLRHLLLQPRTLLVEGGQVFLADFGLAELLWLPAGHNPASFNTRYAAPELFEGHITRSCDEYSLALLFQELLTGVHPFRNLNPRQMASPKMRGRPDLGLLSGPDRNVLQQALAPEPDERFDSCVEMIAALEEASGKVSKPASIRSTSVVRITAAQTRQLPPPQPAPMPSEAVRRLIEEASGGARLCDFRGLRYRLLPGPVIEYQCSARVLPGTLQLKFQGFCIQWKAELKSHSASGAVCILPMPSNMFQRLMGRPPALEINIQTDRPLHAAESLAPVNVVIRPTPGAEQFLEQVGPRLLDSLHHFLQASQDRRREDRYPFMLPLRVVPDFGDDQAGEPIVAQPRDISATGMGFLLPCRPPSEEVFLEVGRPGEPAITLPARIVHSVACPDGRYQVGVAFGSR